MAEVRTLDGSTTPASFVLGRKLDSIPFSGYHILIIAVLAVVGFVASIANPKAKDDAVRMP